MTEQSGANDLANPVLYDLEGAEVERPGVVDGEVLFRNPEVRWVWVLDARHAPYDALSMAALSERARHARKRFVLVGSPAEEPVAAVEP